MTAAWYAPFYLISLLPLRFLYIFSDVAFFLMYYIFRYRRAVVLDNLHNAFPEKGPEEINRIARQFFRHFCDIWVEALKTLTMSRKNMMKRFPVVNPELPEQLYDKGLSVILFMGHLGNWEWMNSLAITVPHQTMAFYQPQSSRYFDGFIRLVRERYGLIAVESSKGYRTLHDYASRGIQTLTLVLGDQRPGGNAPRQNLTFLGRETAFVTGGDRIAAKLGQAVLFPAIRKTGRGRYEFRYIPVREVPDGKSEGIMETYIKLLEQSIRENPAYWLWSHKRWKK